MVTEYIYKCELARAPFQLYQKHFVKKRKAAFIFNDARGGQELWIACLLWKQTVIQKDSLFLKKKSSKNPGKNPARGPERLWYIERVLFHIKAYFPILPRASESKRNFISEGSVGLFTVLFLNVWVMRNYSCCVVKRRARLIWMIPSDDKISTNIIYKD